MNYLWGVYNQYDSDPKYSPDPYLVYLYISHYTENINYDRTAATPNFNSIYAHIISQNDITAFNNFIQNTQYAEVATGIANVGKTIQTISSVQDGVRLYKEEIEDVNEYAQANVSILQTALSAITADAGEQAQIQGAIATSFANNSDSATSAIDLIGRINEQMGNTGGVAGFVENYVDYMKNIMVNRVMGSGFVGLLDGVIGAVELYGSVMMMTSLAGLYYTGQTRRADRLAIHYGLFPWP